MLLVLPASCNGNGGSADSYGAVYSYDPAFSFIISWRPMSGLRTQVTDEYGEVQLNPLIFFRWRHVYGG